MLDWDDDLQSQIDRTQTVALRLLELGGDPVLEMWFAPLLRSPNVFGDIREALRMLDVFCADFAGSSHTPDEVRVHVALQNFQQEIQRKVDECEIELIREVHRSCGNDVEQIAEQIGTSMARVDALWNRCFPSGKVEPMIIAQGGSNARRNRRQ